jgi:hypothetical protein
MRMLHGHKKNTVLVLFYDVIEHAQAALTQNAAAVLLAMCVLRALPSNGFTCHNMFGNNHTAAQ